MSVEWRQAGSVAILAAALAGCGTTSVVKSTPVASDTIEQVKAAPAYLTYYLPTSVVSVSLAAKGGAKAAAEPEASPDAEGADDAAPAKDPKAKDAKAKAPAKPAAAASAKPDPEPKAKSICDQATEGYNFIQGQHADYSVKRVKAVDALRTLAFGPPGSLSTLKQQAAAKAAVAKFASDAALDDARLKAAVALSRRVFDACAFPVVATVSVAVEPDGERAYRMRIPDNGWSADTVNGKADSKGLLTSVSTTADEKSAEVVTGALTSLGKVIGVFSPGSIGVTSQALNLTSAPSTAAAGSEYFERLTPAAVPEAKFRQWLLAQLREIERPTVAELPLLEPKLPLNPVQILLPEVTAKTREPQPIGDSGYFIKLTCQPLPAAIDGPAQTMPVVPAARDGVLVSSMRACVAEVGNAGFQVVNGAIHGKPSAGDTFANAQRWSFVALDSRVSLAASLSRTRLIKRTTSYEFKDGQMVAAAYDKPSNAAAVVALPGNLIGGLLSGISAGIQGRQGTYKDQADLINAKASVYNSQAALIKAQADLEAARKPAAAPDTK